MSRLDRFFGLDDERERQERAPLWKRAVWHALKALVRKHPGAALSAAASGAGYAVKQGVEESAEGIKEKIGDVREGLLRDDASERQDRFMAHEAALAIEGKVIEPEHDAPLTTGATDCLRELSEEKKKAFIDSLKPEDRRALAELARERK